jgi:hypothetical protein
MWLIPESVLMNVAFFFCALTRGVKSYILVRKSTDLSLVCLYGVFESMSYFLAHLFLA